MLNNNRMRQWFFTTIILSPFIGFAQNVNLSPVAKLVDFTPLTDSLERTVQTDIETNTATIASVANARQLVLAFFQEANIQIPAKGFSCIIHVVKWGVEVGSQKLVVGKSNWYVYNPESNWTDSDLKTNKRLFGVSRPYVLLIHLRVPVSVNQSNYGFDYKYRTVHRLPANVQDLKDAFDLFNTGSSSQRLALNTIPPDYWALGSLEGNPPSDIDLTAAISNNGNDINLDSAEVKFDDEGLYRWDISIGFPITSYKQLQSITSDSGVAVPSNIDKRNVLVLANFFLKPVDVKGTTFLAVPHLVGGVSIASKPLHTAMAGVGWGPTLANFYIGSMILTDNLPNQKQAHHYKLAFGLNFPLRTVASKLGLKSQIE